jgi:hypothetical protein
MKIRNGFVSNSSSSSFIIGIAKIKDMNKCKEYLKENDIAEGRHKGVNIVTLRDIKENEVWDVEINKQNKIEISSFTSAVVDIDANGLDDHDNILIYSFCGNEGDGCFMDDEDGWGDYDYDIDCDFFDKKEQDIIDMLSNPEAAGLEDCDWTFGAERNG